MFPYVSSIYNHCADSPFLFDFASRAATRYTIAEQSLGCFVGSNEIERVESKAIDEASERYEYTYVLRNSMTRMYGFRGLERK